VHQQYSGTLKYSNSVTTPLNGVTVELVNSSAVVVATTTTDAAGAYTFTGVANGNYTVRPSIAMIWKAVTSMDVTIYKKHIAAEVGFVLTGMKLISGDVNGSSTLTSMDLTSILQRISTQITSFSVGNWAVESGAITVSGANVTKNLGAICYGDGNTSYFGGSKTLNFIDLSTSETIYAQNGDYLEIPVAITAGISDLASVTLDISYNDDIFDISTVSMANGSSELFYFVNDGVIHIAFSSLSKIDFEANDNMFYIKGYVKNLLNDSYPVQNAEGEFGDYNDVVLSNIGFSVPMLSPNNQSGLVSNHSEIAVYPNPANSFLNVTNVENSTLEVVDILGGNVLISQKSAEKSTKMNIENLATGTYMLRIHKDNTVIIRKFSVVK